MGVIVEVVNVTEVEKDRHTADIEVVHYYENQLFSGGDNGIIKVWTPDLKLVTEFKSHDGQPVYDIVTNPETKDLFTCSSDSTIQMWKFGNGTWSLNMTLRGHEHTVRKLCFQDGVLYSGDEGGEVKLWKNGELKSSCNMIEEVWDMKMKGKRMFTVRDRDVVISEFNDNTSRWWTKKTLPGRGPFFVDDTKILCIDRNGTNILVYSAIDDGFPLLNTLQGHTMIINALTGGDNFAYSGGWDKKVIFWDLRKCCPIGEISIGNVISTICSGGSPGEIYVAGDTMIRRIKVES